MNKNKLAPKRVGELRTSQLMFNYGVGALVDLPRFAVLVQGLDQWPHKPHEHNRVIVEPRLLEQVQKRHPTVTEMLAPPIPNEPPSNDPFDPLKRIGVIVETFPRWLVCPLCKTLAPYTPGATANHFELKYIPNRPAETRFVHTTCFFTKGRKSPQVVPARFLLACEHGHLDEFPWERFVHRGQLCPSSQPQLRLSEMGESGQVTELRVHCDSCTESARPMSDAFDKKRNGDIRACTGRHPHLKIEGEPCDLEARAISLGASNLWFPISMATIAIPASTGGADELMKLVENKWELFNDVEALDELRSFRKFNKPAAALIRDYDDATVWQVIERVRRAQAGDTPPTPDNIRLPEWLRFSTADPSANDGEDFEIEQTAVPSEFSPYLDKVVLVHRLREARALIGFTRLSTQDDETAADIEIAPLSRHTLTWVPAHEVRGEGVFIQFKEELIQAWLARPAVQERNKAFYESHIRWGETRGIADYEKHYPGIRYILLHSFAHALMRALALESGYALSSVRERIYAQDETDDEPAMAGILLYTASSDSEGTLGGLVNLGRAAQLDAFIERALDDASFCSSDPLCAEHKPSREGRTIQAAACHACSLLPETSCERGNRYLDRSLLVPTVVDVPGLAFFD